jgi:hypothetical protein
VALLDEPLADAFADHLVVFHQEEAHSSSERKSHRRFTWPR